MVKKMEKELKNVIMKTNLEYPLLRRGKVRDLYDLKDKLLIVATDRISAFDVVLPNGIPYKGESLNLLSAYWFKETEKIVQNHLLKVVDSRTILVKKTIPLKVEVVVRGYIYGSAWEKYKKGKKVSGIQLPTGLKRAENLPQPIVTPSTKAEVGHDLEITKKEVIDIIGKERAEEIEEFSLKIYESASKQAERKGIIIADTKFEFGTYMDQTILIDEILTPDSSRFWPKDSYVKGKSQSSFDKQYVRDYLSASNWNKEPPAPKLPDNVILETSRKYIEVYERLTGKKFHSQRA
jgi:phosphoribosylaminoimidazole-succinocarboxamide synthase